MIKRKGEIRSPYLRPMEYMKVVKGAPFTNIEKKGAAIIDLIQ